MTDATGQFNTTDDNVIESALTEILHKIVRTYITPVLLEFPLREITIVMQENGREE